MNLCDIRHLADQRLKLSEQEYRKAKKEHAAIIAHLNAVDRILNSITRKLGKRPGKGKPKRSSKRTKVERSPPATKIRNEIRGG